MIRGEASASPPDSQYQCQKSDQVFGLVSEVAIQAEGPVDLKHTANQNNRPARYIIRSECSPDDIGSEIDEVNLSAQGGTKCKQ